MKMPDRPDGAGGSLIRANLYDAAPTPPFSRTRHGANTIHKRNGDLVVTRDRPVATEPPWLLIPYSYDAALSKPFETLLHRLGLFDEQRIDQPVGSSAPNEITALGLVYVGDGWMLEMYQVNPERTLHLRLRAVDALEETVDLGVTIGPFEVGFPSEMGVSLCAMGWRDSENGYAFAAYYFHVGTGKNRCLVGSVKKKAITSTVDMPDSPSGEGWWTPATYIGQNTATIDFGYAKLYAVGRGHLLGLLVPMESIEYGKTSGGVPLTAPRAGFLTPAGAPQFVRSRDFGESFTLEPAQFLTELGVLKAPNNIEDPDAGTYDVPARLFAWGSSFYACPIGEGRVAIVAGGKSDAPPLEFDPEPDQWVFGIENQTLRFFISGAGGADFTPRAWQLDAGRNAFPIALGAPEASTDTIISPLFGYGATNQYALGTLGPGTFFALAEQVTRTNPGFIYGAYPAAQPLLAYVTRDYGNTWDVEQIPSELVPFATTFYEAKAVWVASSTPIFTGDGTQVPDSWLYTWVGVCVTDPCNDKGEGGDVVFFTGEMRGPLALAYTSGKKTFADMDLLVVEDKTLWTPHPTRVTGISQPFYTGDPLSKTRPETIRLGYPEFEDRT